MSSSPAAAASARPMVTLKSVSKRYGTVDALYATDLKVMKGEFVTLLGPSGSGKTTILNLIAGMILPSAGSIVLDGRDVTTIPANLAGVPGMGLPIGLAPEDGLPVGFQIMAPAREDARLYSLGATLERLLEDAWGHTLLSQAPQL